MGLETICYYLRQTKAKIRVKWCVFHQDIVSWIGWQLSTVFCVQTPNGRYLSPSEGPTCIADTVCLLSAFVPALWVGVSVGVCVCVCTCVCANTQSSSTQLKTNEAKPTKPPKYQTKHPHCESEKLKLLRHKSSDWVCACAGCVPSMHKTLSLTKKQHKTGPGYTGVIPALGERGKDDQKFKVIFVYVVIFEAILRYM